MSDKITGFVQIKDTSNVVIQYDVAYDVDDGSGHSNSFCVVITAGEMTDATDVAEAKTKANVKAAAIKSDWVSSMATMPTVVSQDAQVGNVTL